MERILVGLDDTETTLWAAIHAINLAKRMSAKVSILLVMTPSRDRKRLMPADIETAARKRLEPLIKESGAEGVGVDYYITHGAYETELARFVEENGITLLVVGLPAIKPKHKSGEFDHFMEGLRHRVNCRIEIVHEKPSL